MSGLFAPLDAKTRLYRRLEHSIAAVPVEFPATAVPHRHPSGEGDSEALAQQKAPPPNIQALADRVLVQRFSPVAVPCTAKGDLLYVSGRAGKYLEPVVGKANLNIFAMAREGLRYELSRAFSQATRQERVVTVRGLKVGTNGATQIVDLTVQRLAEPKELGGTVMVVIADAPTGQAAAKVPRQRPASAAPRIVELEHELERAREEVQTTREEMQTSQEELKSTNEELQSTNEELQSSNEELTTSKEEMQSLNEELQTVSHELQAKADEMSRSNSDMKNLLNSTDIATLFLDGDLNVRRFTTPTTRIIKLIPGDAGRPITDITTELQYSDLADDAREVLRTLVFKEKQVATRDARWFSMRIMPYRTLENLIDGVVITFADATAVRTLADSFKEQASQLQQMADSLPNLVWGCRADGTCEYVNKQWVEYTGIPEKEHYGYGWFQHVHQDDRERVREDWRNAVRSGSPFDAELRLRRADGSHRWFKARSVPIRDAQAQIVRWYGTNTDVDDLKRADVGRAV